MPWYLQWSLLICLLFHGNIKHYHCILHKWWCSQMWWFFPSCRNWPIWPCLKCVFNKCVALKSFPQAKQGNTGPVFVWDVKWTSRDCLEAFGLPQIWQSKNGSHLPAWILSDVFCHWAILGTRNMQRHMKYSFGDSEVLQVLKRPSCKDYIDSNCGFSYTVSIDLKMYQQTCN